MYEFALEHNLLFSKKEPDFIHFSNIVTVFCQAQKMEVAHALLLEYKKYVPKKLYNEVYFRYQCYELLYNRDLKKLRLKLKKNTYESLGHKLQYVPLELKCLLELKDPDFLEKHKEYKGYFKRKCESKKLSKVNFLKIENFLDIIKLFYEQIFSKKYKEYNNTFIRAKFEKCKGQIVDPLWFERKLGS